MIEKKEDFYLLTIEELIFALEIEKKKFFFSSA